MNNRIGLPYFGDDGFPFPNAELRDLSFARGWCQVIASVYYTEDEATVVLLYRESPYFGVAQYALEHDALTDVSRHENIVPAIEEYTQRGGDY